MDVFLLALLTTLNALFAMSEMALSTSRRARLAALAETGDAGAAAALDLMESPTQFLSTVQIGITSIGMLSGIVGEAAFAGPLAIWMEGAGMGPGAASFVSTAVVVSCITFFTIIFGELVPKRIGQLYPEPVARHVARPMHMLAAAAKPFVLLLSGATAAILKLLRIDLNAGRMVTEEEISASLEEGVDAGVIEMHEHQMVRNVFHLDDRRLSSLMVPRADIDWLEASASVEEALRKVSVDAVRDEVHSWYPVCRGSLDDVVGTISVARLLALGLAHTGTIEEAAQPAIFVPETLTGMELLEQFRARAARLVFVVDEYGVVQGLMTPGDLLEAITGELQTATQGDAWAHKRPDGVWELDGLMPVAELRARLGIRELPDEDRGRYNTVAGLLIFVAGHLPEVNEEIDCEGWRFRIVALDGKRIDRVLARSIAAAAQNVAA
ncbi:MULTISPECIES: hemolysin family protein [unclassified Variovorax]|uniref:hemolysin family protein n=1 Tax=unclassified Variovorax TaxID=663243 RepID=UPI00076D555E|nr:MULTISPECIES: hemolysin family protein [unclassified Variovorax]KWT97077.1 Hemolysin [Variovorax sp. WDL1]PNG47076.1 Magnesium and cobalt efflux protein CorC [Variovorax sp. B2]PNG48273.1 Magnesium and cobalt efflux protein CorC [Variovorax sp. B4]VTV14938.1 Magnesium and cobalt efflux protein CorC [Variovorax sp. WDL1]